MREPFCGARCYLNSLMFIEILLALIIMIVTTIYYQMLAQYIVPKNRKILFGQLFNFYIFAFQIIVLYIASLILWRRLWRLPYTRDTYLFVNLWLFITTLMLICGFATIWSVSACIDEVEAAAETAMLNGIDDYYSCPDWKILWDELQFYRQCCGVNSYIDWKDAVWMSDALGLTRNCGGNCKSSVTSIAYAPYACCRRDYLVCYENFKLNTHHVGSLNVSFINTAGCLPLFTQNLWRLIYIVLGLLMVSLKLQAFVCVLVRFIMKRQCHHQLEQQPKQQRKSLASILKKKYSEQRPDRRRSSYVSIEDQEMELDMEAEDPSNLCKDCGCCVASVNSFMQFVDEDEQRCCCQAISDPEIIH